MKKDHTTGAIQSLCLCLCLLCVFVCMSVCLSVCLFDFVLVYMSSCLSARLSVCLSDYPYLCMYVFRLSVSSSSARLSLLLSEDVPLWLSLSLPLNSSVFLSVLCCPSPEHIRWKVFDVIWNLSKAFHKKNRANTGYRDRSASGEGRQQPNTGKRRYFYKPYLKKKVTLFKTRKILFG